MFTLTKCNSNGLAFWYKSVFEPFHKCHSVLISKRNDVIFEKLDHLDNIYDFNTLVRCTALSWVSVQQFNGSL